jgi:CheY-like chemotaxis protein
VRRVLIVEDDAGIRDTLAQVLEFEGYDVGAAADGKKALASARLQHPDIILLDLMMPIMDGWQFRAAQKEDPTICDIPVVVVSALGSRRDIDAVAFIPKPFRVEQVLEAVERFGAQRPHPQA